jgi:acyl dehydratase
VSNPIDIRFDAAPGFGAIYRGILLTRKKGFRPGQAWPKMRSTWPGAKADPAKVTAYRAACGLQDDGKLPLLYPHVLTSPLHLGIMAHKAFPLSPLGGVHARNVILQHRAIGVGESLDLEATLCDARVLKGGLEFDIATTICVGPELVWQGLSTYLFLGKRGKYGAPTEGYEPPRIADLGTVGKTATWRVPPDMGRRYAKITGDYNPIHVSKLLAKVFGFKRDLIHGMWSAAKALGETGATIGSTPVRFDVIFKGPIWIGAQTDMKIEAGAAGHRFDLFCTGNDRPCINAILRDAQPGERL